jgi:protein-disulfide isomerase
MTEGLEMRESSWRSGLARGSIRALRARARLLAGLVTAIAIAAAVASVGCGSSSNAQPTPGQQITPMVQATPTVASTPRPITVETGTNPSKGPADAKVTIVDFSDFQGPSCSAFAQQTLPQILADYGDKVRVVFMNVPLKKDNYAEKAAEAGECANAQGSFWQYHDLLFQNQQVLTGLLTPEPTAGVAKVVDTLKGYAAQLGLDTATFNDCLDSGKMAAAVQADMAVAGKAITDAGLSSFGLPSFFINGKYLEGAQSYDVFKQAIDAALAVAN